MNSLVRPTCCTPKCEVISRGKWKPKPWRERALRLHTCAPGNLVKISVAGESMCLFSKGTKSQLLMQLLNIRVIAIIWKVNLENTPSAKDPSCWLFPITTLHYCCREVPIICISICFTGLIFIPEKSYRCHYALTMFAFIVTGTSVPGSLLTPSSSQAGAGSSSPLSRTPALQTDGRACCKGQPAGRSTNYTGGGINKCSWFHPEDIITSHFLSPSSSVSNQQRQETVAATLSSSWMMKWRKFRSHVF